MTPLLDVRNLTKTFVSGPSSLTVVNDVSFSVDTGATCAIIGPSGSGKTTLLGLCAGLDLPSSGSVSLAGHRLDQMSEDERALLRNQSIGFVFQNFQLIPSLTALENVMVPLEIHRSGFVRDKGVALLQKVGLGERLTHYPVQLSGGEQQRVALARAFINEPKVLFADEPTGNLDAETGHTIVETLFEMNAAFGTTLILITHDPELARRTRSVLTMKGGRLVSVERLS